MWDTDTYEVQTISGPWMQGTSGGSSSGGGGGKSDKDAPRPGDSDCSGSSNG